MKKAIVIGSTGMVGRQLIELLTELDEYIHVISLVRRPSGFIHPKLTEHIVDFDQPEVWKPLVKGDVLFSCMGTTLKQAGSKQSQYQIDYTYQYQVAQIAAANGVNAYVLISSAGASVSSAFFYSRMKGELDDAVLKLHFDTVNILRPAQLYGDREEKRSAERFALKIMFFLNKTGLFRKYRPIHARQLAQAMVNIAGNPHHVIVSYNEIFKLI